MKSLRLIPAAFLLLSIATVHGADSKSKSGSKAKATPAADKKASPTPAPDTFKLPDPVATVDGKPITKAELQKEFEDALKTIGKPASELTPIEKQQGYSTVLNNMIIDRILRAKSADVKVSDEEVDKVVSEAKSQFPDPAKFDEALKKLGQTLDQMKQNIRVSLQQQKWIESQIASKVDVTEAEAKEFYDKNPDKFQVPAQVRASHILFAFGKENPTADEVAAKKKLADDAEARIKKGEDFGKLANELSDDHGGDPTTGQPSPKQTQGGDLNFFSKEQMVPEFSEQAFKMKVGDVSDPVKTQFGWHIIKVTDKKDARTIPFDEVKDKLIAYLKQGKQRAAITQLISSLRSKADVKVFLPEPPKSALPSLPGEGGESSSMPPQDTTAPAGAEGKP